MSKENKITPQKWVTDFVLMNQGAMTEEITLTHFQKQNKENLWNLTENEMINLYHRALGKLYYKWDVKPIEELNETIKEAIKDLHASGKTQKEIIEKIQEAASEENYKMTAKEIEALVIEAIPDDHKLIEDLKRGRKKAKKASWADVTDNDVREAIKDTKLGELVNTLGSVTTPNMPLEITLPNAITLCGAAMVNDNEVDGRHGKDRLKLSIRTANGLATNIYSIILAESCAGKDVGGLVPDTARRCGLYLSGSASAEGFADALQYNGSGVLLINEMQPYLDKRTWEYKLIGELTKLFNLGFFKWSLSKRATSKNRESDFAFPSLVASVQPEVFKEKADKNEINSGFFGRCLITVANEPREAMLLRVPNVLMTGAVATATNIINQYQKLTGVIQVAPDYLQNLREDIAFNRDIPSTSIRICNEYGPKLATILACDITLTPDHWQRAEVLCRWFIQHQIAAYGMVGRSSEATYSQRVKHCEREIIKAINRLLDNDKLTTKRNIIRSSNYLTSTATHRERDEGIKSLIDSGQIEEVQHDRHTVYKPL